jgi:hypothetical protein
MAGQPFDNSRPDVVVLLNQGEKSLRKVSIVVIVGTFLLSACSMTGSLKSKQAIKGAIEAHLKGNPHLSLKNFDTYIENVKFKDNTAEAMAKFVSKTDPNSAVEVRYQLKLDGRMWKVVSSEPAGAQGMGMGAHGGTAGSMHMGQPVQGKKGQTSPVPESSH